ncbi:MAG: hypothetical protein V4694_02140 [Pseudomonadota bacterium]
MIKIISSLFLILSIISSPALAQSAISKNQTNYLLFKRIILEAKNNNWNLSGKIRRLGAIERWPAIQLQKELENTNANAITLAKYNKNLSAYSDAEFAADFAEVQNITDQISDSNNDIQRRIEVHDSIQKMIKTCRKDILAAKNKALQLRNIRQRILSYYNAKYNGQYASAALGITENILETQQLIVDINQQNLAVDAIEKAENAKSATNEIPYDPAQLLQSLQEIDVSVLIIAKQTAENIKKDNITMQAAALLGAT